MIPGALREASEDPVSAMAVVLGLILRRDPAQRAAQLVQAEPLAGGEVVKEARRLDALLRTVPAGSRVALLDLSMPALRQLSPAQVAAFVPVPIWLNSISPMAPIWSSVPTLAPSSTKPSIPPRAVCKTCACPPWPLSTVSLLALVLHWS